MKKNFISYNNNKIFDWYKMEYCKFISGSKGRRFNLEDTHLTDTNKISKLISLISIAFVWAHKVGEYKDSKIMKNHRVQR